MVTLHPETMERLRAMEPRAAYDTAREALLRLGSAGSEDFLDLWQQLVDEGVLTWDQVEEFEAS